MWASTRSCAPERGGRLARALAVAALALLPAAVAQADLRPPALPASVAQLAPTLRPQGGAEFTFFGLSIYDGYYWSPSRGWTLDRPFALDLHYHRSLVGAKIAERSVEEIEKLGYGTPDDRKRWGREMTQIFPDVKDGDSILGLHLPGGPVRFFLNGKPIGSVADPGFARAFFGIWLDPKTSRPDFRKKLLGEDG